MTAPKKINFCIYCGAALPQQAKFCPDCGKPVETTIPVVEKPVSDNPLVAGLPAILGDKKKLRALLAIVAAVFVMVVAIALIAGGKGDIPQDGDLPDVPVSDNVEDDGENTPQDKVQGDKQDKSQDKSVDDPSVLPYLMDVDSSGEYYLADEKTALKVRFEAPDDELYTVAEEYVALLESRGYTAELTEAYDLPEGWTGDVKLWTLHHPEVEGTAQVRYERYISYDQCYIDLGWDGEITFGKKFLRPTGDVSVLPSFDRYDPTTCFYEADESLEGTAIYEISRYEGYQPVVDYVEALAQYGWNEVDSNHMIYNDTDIGVVSSWELRNKDVEGNLRVKVAAWEDDDRCYVTFTMPQGLQMEDFSMNHGTVDTSSSGSSDDSDFFEKCSACHGSGDCTHCGGDDEVKKFQEGLGWVEQNCTFCTGGRCRHCGGDGKP